MNLISASIIYSRVRAAAGHRLGDREGTRLLMPNEGSCKSALTANAKEKVAGAWRERGWRNERDERISRKIVRQTGLKRKGDRRKEEVGKLGFAGPGRRRRGSKQEISA